MELAAMPGGVQRRRNRAEPGMCAICFEDIVQKDLCIIKKCKHGYCEKCIWGWARWQTSYGRPVWCPLCRGPVNLEELKEGMSPASDASATVLACTGRSEEQASGQYTSYEECFRHLHRPTKPRGFPHYH